MARHRDDHKRAWDVDTPDNPQYPRDDAGENFIYYLALAPFRLIAAPFRFIIGIVSAKEMDEEIAKRGVLYGEENPEVVEEVVNEYGERFYRGGRRR
jgi:hypothetical protein